MARETHPPPSSAPSPFGLPGLGKGRGYPLHGDPTRGAALDAPTAPHATSPVERPSKLTGPARFWSGGRMRTVLALTFAFSLAMHWFIAPWNLLPDSSGVEFKDPEGDLSIPVDLLGEEAPPAPAPAPPEPVPEPPTPEATKDPTAPRKPDAGAKIVDAGVDAAVKLAEIHDAGAGEDQHEARGDRALERKAVAEQALRLVAPRLGPRTWQRRRLLVRATAWRFVVRI